MPLSAWTGQMKGSAQEDAVQPFLLMASHSPKDISQNAQRFLPLKKDVQGFLHGLSDFEILSWDLQCCWDTLTSLHFTHRGFMTRIEPLLLPLAWLTHLWVQVCRVWPPGEQYLLRTSKISLWNCLLLFNLTDIFQPGWGSTEVACLLNSDELHLWTTCLVSARA